MGTLAVLEQLFDPVYLIPVDGGQVALVEENEGAKLKQIRLTGLPDGTYVLKLDAGQLGYFLRSEKGQRKCCDYVLVLTWRQKLLLIFVELKSRHYEASDVKHQFIGAECAIDYCDAVLRRFHSCNGFFDGAERRFFLFYHGPSINKRQTRPKRAKHKPNTAATMHKFPIQGADMAVSLGKLIA